VPVLCRQCRYSSNNQLVELTSVTVLSAVFCLFLLTFSLSLLHTPYYYVLRTRGTLVLHVVDLELYALRHGAMALAACVACVLGCLLVYRRNGRMNQTQDMAHVLLFSRAPKAAYMYMYLHVGIMHVMVERGRSLGS